MTARPRWLALVLVPAIAGCAPGPVHRAVDGQLTGRGRFVNNHQQGPWTLFAEGRRIAAGTFAAGVPTGIWKTYHDNGALQERAEFAAGARHGKAATFRRDGSPESQGSYEHGVQDGPWLYWDALGQLDATRTGFYRAGVRQP